MARKLVASLTRFAEDAPLEARALFGRALLAALSELGIYPGDAFLVVHPDAMDPSQCELGPFQKDSETSRSAAIDNYPRAGTQRERVLNFVHAQLERGATRDELAVALELPLATICPRVWELIAGEWLRETHERRPTREGSEGFVLVTTPKVRLALDSQVELAANSG